MSAVHIRKHISFLRRVTLGLVLALVLGAATPVFGASLSPQEALDRVFEHLNASQSQILAHIQDIPAVEGFTDEQVIQYFIEVAMSSEFGGYHGSLMRYESPIHYYVLGNPDSEDIAQLEALAAALNQVPGFPGISRTYDQYEANYKIMFDAEEVFEQYFDIYVPDGNWGYASVNYYTLGDLKGCISSTDAWISNSAQPRRERNSVIAEEFIQGMGMLNDPEYGFYSIFEQYSNSCDWPSALDWAVIKLLYDPRMERFVTEEQAREMAQIILDSWK